MALKAQTVLLVNPYSKWGLLHEPPHGLLYIAAYLNQFGCSIKIIDRNACFAKSKDPDKLLEFFLKEHKPSFIGITSFTSQILDAFHVANLIKKNNSQTKIILGGIHAMALPEETLKQCKDIDFICCGEGEKVMFELISGKEPSLINGLAFRLNGEIRSNPNGDLLSLDDLPFPVRDLADTDFYSNFSWPFRLGSLFIFTSRGCPRNCTFCARFGKFPKIRQRSLNNIFEEIKMLSKRYSSIRALIFSDDTFMPNNERVIEFCKVFIKNNYHKRFFWRAALTADRAELEMLSWMKKANCQGISYGFESASPRILAFLKKGVTADGNYRAARLTRKVGIPYSANIMFNVPGETKEDVLATIRFIRDVNPDIINIFYYRPCPGSPLFDQLYLKGKINLDWNSYTWEGWDEKDEHYFSLVDKKWLFNMVNKLNKSFRYPNAIKLYYKTLIEQRLFIYAIKKRSVEIVLEIINQPFNIVNIAKKYFLKYFQDLLYLKSNFSDDKKI